MTSPHAKARALGSCCLLVATLAACATGGRVVAGTDSRAAASAEASAGAQQYPWGRVECGRGPDDAHVCSDVAVTHVDTRSDPVAITLKNTTLDTLAVQVQLETFRADGERAQRTGFHELALAPSQESVLTLWQRLEDGDTIVVTLKDAG